MTGREEVKRTAPRPLRLRRLLAEHGLSQRQLAAALIQDAGRNAGQPMSPAAVAQLLNRGLWPVGCSRAAIEDQTRALLAAHGVPAADAAGAWQVDEHPLGVPVRPEQANRRGAGARANESGPAANPEDQLPEPEMLTQEAMQAFGLSADPFLDDVQCAADVYLPPEQQYIRGALWQAANHGGFLAVIGECGAGKSVLRRDLIARVSRDKAPLVVIQPKTIDKGRLTAAAISEAIICAVSIEAPKRTTEARDRQVERVLTASSRANSRHVLLIEEAHDLTIGALKMLKRYWELEDGFRRLLAIVLLGQPELHDALDERINWDAREVIRRCEIAELRPLGEHVERYCRLKLSRVKADPDRILAPDAYPAIRARLTVSQRNTDEKVDMTYPLSVNNALKRAMNAAVAIAARVGERPLVTRQIVERL
jgi:type II secretory pathway predicted ATPase ExeA